MPPSLSGIIPFILRTHRNLKRNSLNTVTLALTVFCCVSGGPFGLEELVSNSGPGFALLLILVIPILWAIPDALTTCELAPAIPVEGGYIVWCKRALGPFWGFLNAWWTWIYAVVDAAIYPVMFAAYVVSLAKAFAPPSPLLDEKLFQWGLGMLVIVAFTVLNIRGTKLVGRASSLFAALILAPFALMAIIGAYKLLASARPLPTQFLPPDQSLTGAFAGGLGIVLWNYLGWDALSTVAEEVEEPAKAYPKALLWGIPLVTAAYFFPTLIGLLYVPDSAAWVEGEWPNIAKAAAGEGIGLLVNLAGVVAPIALFTASLLATSRVPFVLAEDGYLPKRVQEIHPKYGTPWLAVLLNSAIYTVLTLQFTFMSLVELNVTMYSAALILETLALLVLRVKEPDLPRPFKIPGGWPVLILILLLPVTLIAILAVTSIQEEGWMAQWPTAAALLSGPIVWAVVTAIKRRTTA